MRRLFDITKWAFDVLAAAAGLIAFGWLGAIIYLWVRLTSPGRGFYVQDRVGKGGRTFRMLKFRTMRTDHRHDPDPSIVIGDGHPAVTPIGRFLRRTKLDELPQLINVLAGRMSLVGPRPTVPEQAAEYDDFKRRRLEVRPGITGLAQVNGGTHLTWDERIQWDVHYVDRRGWRLDLTILFRTVLCTLGGSQRYVRRLWETDGGS